jgi:hypothetical protein
MEEQFIVDIFMTSEVNLSEFEKFWWKSLYSIE